MQNVFETILARRSIRRFLPTQIPEEALQQVLQAGLYAPSAGGRQGVLFVVSQEAATNRALGCAKRRHTQVRPSTPTAYVSREQPSIADDPTLLNAFYDAPTVITLFAPKGFLFAESDCAVAAENMLLAATALGLGSCLIGSAWEAFAEPFGQETLRRWHVPVAFYAVLQVLLGLPRDPTPPKARPRCEGRILRF